MAVNLSNTRAASPGQAQPSMQIHIEQLVLHGFPSLARGQIGPQVEAHLARLLAEQGAPASLVRGGLVSRLDGGAFEIDADASPEKIAEQIAHSIYGAVR